MRYRTIFLSDAHLGMRGVDHSPLLDFLQANDCDSLYLVGDIIDHWALRRSTRGWNDTCNKVVQEILKKAQEGARVVYVCGNHDDVLRKFIGIDKIVSVVNRAIHTLANGKRVVVVHGDLFDDVEIFAPWLSAFGAHAYETLFRVSIIVNAIQRAMRMRQHSISRYVKHITKRAVKIIDAYEDHLVDHARDSGTEGVVCGHIHYPDIKTIRDFVYVNCGDWVETHSAAVEDYDGKISIVRNNAARQ